MCIDNLINSHPIRQKTNYFQQNISKAIATSRNSTLWPNFKNSLAVISIYLFHRKRTLYRVVCSCFHLNGLWKAFALCWTHRKSCMRKFEKKTFWKVFLVRSCLYFPFIHSPLNSQIYCNKENYTRQWMPLSIEYKCVCVCVCLSNAFVWRWI